MYLNYNVNYSCVPIRRPGSLINFWKKMHPGLPYLAQVPYLFWVILATWSAIWSLLGLLLRVGSKVRMKCCKHCLRNIHAISGVKLKF